MLRQRHLRTPADLTRVFRLGRVRHHHLAHLGKQPVRPDDEVIGARRSVGEPGRDGKPVLLQRRDGGAGADGHAKIAHPVHHHVVKDRAHHAALARHVRRIKARGLDIVDDVADRVAHGQTVVQVPLLDQVVGETQVAERPAGQRRQGHARPRRTPVLFDIDQVDGHAVFGQADRSRRSPHTAADDQRRLDVFRQVTAHRVLPRKFLTARQ